MRSYAYAVVYILIAIILAHLVAPVAYVWSTNSISQLAGQGYPLAWIMRAGFIGFGVLVQIIGIRRMRTSDARWFREIPIMLYGLSILLSGLYSTSPFIEGLAYSEAEARLHALLATAAGLALSAAMLLFALTDPPSSRKALHTAALVLTMLLSFLFGALPEAAGLIQRALWLVGFSWLIFLRVASTRRAT